LLDILGQDDEARLQINLALEIDPFFSMMRIGSAVYYYHEGKFKESLDECLKVQELDPDYISAYWICFYIYVRMGEDSKAMEELQKIMYMDTLTAKNVNVVKEVYSKSGINGILNWLIELQLDNLPPFTLAKNYAMLEKKDDVLDLLEKALEENLPNIARINNDPDFDNLLSEPRFIAIIKKLGLSEYANRE